MYNVASMGKVQRWELVWLWETIRPYLQSVKTNRLQITKFPLVTTQRSVDSDFVHTKDLRVDLRMCEPSD